MDYNKVVCTVCNVELRKNQWIIDRHWENKHKDRLERGEKASTKLPSAGSSTMTKHFRVLNKDAKEAEIYGEILAQEANLEESVGLEQESEDPGAKRILPDGENNHENPAKKFKDDVIAVILQKLETIDKKVDDMKEKERQPLHEEKVEKSAGESDLVDKKFKESSNIKDLEVVLQSFQFLKREDIKEGMDGYFCELCFGGSEPNWESPQIAGAFKFAKTEETDDLQSRQLRNLKKSAKSHILESKVHLQKKTLKDSKDANLKKALDRTKVVGMNVFRERYSGIKQSKSRLDFEEDMLRAKMCGTDVGDLNHSNDFAKKLDVAIYSELKENMKESMQTVLDATGKIRPAGLMMDKMTPRKRTGQMHSSVIPVPENPLSQVRSLHWVAIGSQFVVSGFSPPHDA